LFAFGSGTNSISLGFNTIGRAVLRIGDETYTSTISITNDETWKYIGMAYNRENNTVSVYQFEGTTVNTLFTNRALTEIPATQGRLFVGNNAAGTDGFEGAIAQLHFYGVNRSQTAILVDKSKHKTGRELGLIGYWTLDEGMGEVARDKARSRHLVLNTDWYIYPSGFAKQTNNTYFSIPTATYPLDAFSDFTLEFWFRSANENQVNQTLFSADNGSIGVNAGGALVLYRNDGTVNQILTTTNLMDTRWHHFAMSVRRGGSVNVHINGASTAIFPETQLGSFVNDNNNFYFGARRASNNTYSQYFAGYFDEIRIWNSALSRENILLNQNSKLRGDEAGLQAYYPFETYTRLPNGLINVMRTNNNMAGNDSAAGSATGFSATAVPVKDARPVEFVPFTYVASDNKIVFTLDPSFFARVEGTQLNITVKDVWDMRNNRSNAEHWTAYVRRNALQWETDPISVVMEQEEIRTFTARIANTGGLNTSYSIENLPAWLSVNAPVGNLQPLGHRDLTFTVNRGVNAGNYETAIGLTSGNGVMEILPVQLKVTGQRPDWDVNPNDFESSMNIIGQIKIAGVFQEDTEDLLAAFIGDLCVGVASPIYVDAMGSYFAFASIFGNPQHANQPLTFRLWKASTGRIYPKIETSIANIRFNPSTVVGTPVNPVIFDALDVTQQTISLQKGWTWISANVLNNNPTIFDQMKSSLGSAGVMIKGQTSFVQQPNWMGTLNSISEKTMYAVNTNRAHTLVLEGQFANPALTPITINKGWNWIGYVPSFTLQTQDALAGINVQPGDMIKSQTAFATYIGNGNWIGTLDFMQPGRGYMYFSNNATPQILIYPSQASQMQKAPMLAGNSSSVTPRWTVDPSRFSSNMTMTCIVVNSNVEMRSNRIEIGAFSGNEVRGSAVLQYETSLDKYIGFLMVYGEGNEPITLKVYDHDASKEHNANNAPIPFVAEAILGIPNLFVVGLGTTQGSTDIGETINDKSVNIYPNPVDIDLFIERPWTTINVLEILDLSGKIVLRETNFSANSINVSTLNPGFYVLRLIHNDQVIVRRFIKK
jgi:hypothetical protein